MLFNLRLSIRFAAVAAVIAVFVSADGHVNASAVTGIDFSGGAGHGTTSFTRTVSGTSIVATFDNVFVEQGNQVFSNYGDGLNLGSGGLGGNWDVTFDANVGLTDTNANIIGNVYKGFDVTGPGLNALALLDGTPKGNDQNFSFATPLVFLAGQTYTFDARNSNLAPTVGGPSGGTTFRSWTIDTNPVIIPEPTAALFLCGSGVLAGLRRRRR